MELKTKQRGYVIAVVALLLTVMVGFLALSIDIGVMYSARTQLQAAADSGALAGAFSFVTQPFAPQPETAQAEATGVTTANKILGSIPLVTVDVDVANRLVTVRTSKQQPTFFARVLAINSVAISASASAEAQTHGTGTTCLKPWFLANTIFSDQAGVQNPCQACARGWVLMNKNSYGDYSVTAWARTLISGNNRLILRSSNPPQPLNPGGFYEMDFGFGNAYEDGIANCGMLGFVHEMRSVLTGTRIGPSDSGTRALIGCPTQDTYMSPGVYRRVDGTLTDTSRSLVAAPIWDDCNTALFCPQGRFPGGHIPTLRIVGFAVLFVEGLQYEGGGPISCDGQNIVARLVNLAPAASIDPTQTGPYGIPVRLVRR